MHKYKDAAYSNLLAIESIPGPVCLKEKSSSAKWSPYMLILPVPSELTKSPPKLSNRAREYKKYTLIIFQDIICTLDHKTFDHSVKNGVLVTNGKAALLEFACK